MTTDAVLRCLILNAGGSYLADKSGAMEWASTTACGLSRPHIAFIQEVPSDAWLDVWHAAGYRSILGYRRGWRVRSALLTTLKEPELPGLDVRQVPELRYHGEYVAAAQLTGWGPGDADVTLLSVHASPNPTSSEYLSHYPDPGRILRRDGGQDPRYRGELFDADAVLETISRYAPSVIACGDFNEAPGWDEIPSHRGQTWGAEYFGIPDSQGVRRGGSVQKRQLVDVPLRASGKEVVTRTAPGHPALQLDHIITSPRLARQIDNVIVPKWSTEDGWGRGLSDHAPIRFDVIRTRRNLKADTAHETARGI